MEKKRCFWAENVPEIYVRYHDEEWGREVHDDHKLFEMLLLESFQAGLSWLTILKKREAFREAFDAFDVAKVAGYTEEKQKSRHYPQPSQNQGRSEKCCYFPADTTGIRQLFRLSLGLHRG